MPTDAFQPPRSLTDTIADWLVDQMNAGLLKPGQQLNIDALAREFGVSQTPIREALKSLQAEKLVEYPFHCSPRVATLTKKAVQDIFLCRAELFGLAAELATLHMDAARLEMVQELVEKMEAAVRVHDVQSYLEIDTQFNNAILRFSENESLVGLLETLRRRTEHFRHEFITKDSRMAASQESHHQIVDAFRHGDANLARELMVGHVRSALNMLSDDVFE